ncbi:hypothetical protein [Pseudomonas mohnii]
MTLEDQAYSHALGKRLDELLGMNAVLRDDINALLEAFGDDWDNQVFRRNFVRACWAYIEAVVYGVKETTLCAVNLSATDLPLRDLKFLTGVTYIVSTDGGVKAKAVWCNTEENIRCALRIAADCFDRVARPDFNDVGWCKTKVSVQLRHRLVHPKCVTQLRVSDQEFDDQREAFIWFAGLFTKFISDMDGYYG